jgi:hypothetical protein
VHRESISGLTGARAVVWRLGDGGGEAALVALGVGGAWAREEEKESERRCGGGRWGSPPFIGAEGGGGQWLRRRNGRC